MERPSIDASHVPRCPTTNAKSASCLAPPTTTRRDDRRAGLRVDAQQAPSRRLRPWQWRRRWSMSRGPSGGAAQPRLPGSAPPPRKSAIERRRSRVRARSAARTATGDATTTRLRGGGGWTNEFGDEYDAIDDDDGISVERRAFHAGKARAAGTSPGGRYGGCHRRRGGFGRAEVGERSRRARAVAHGGRRNDRRRDDDGDWVEVRPNDGSAREELRCARPRAAFPPQKLADARFCFFARV